MRVQGPIFNTQALGKGALVSMALAKLNDSRTVISAIGVVTFEFDRSLEVETVNKGQVITVVGEFLRLVIIA